MSLTGSRLARRGAHYAIRAYQLTLSSLVGRQCRHWPSCSEYADEAIARHGLWAGAWMGVARITRCGPFGTAGIDLVPDIVPPRARWYAPWRYGSWRAANAILPGAGEAESASFETPPSAAPQDAVVGRRKAPSRTTTE
jgi:putative membrane protein insertion efficiency factor